MEVAAAASAAVEWVGVGWRRAVVLIAGCLPMAAAGTWRRWGGDRAAQVAPGGWVTVSMHRSASIWYVV